MFKNGIAYAAVFAGAITFETLRYYLNPIVAGIAGLVVFLLIAGSGDSENDVRL